MDEVRWLNEREERAWRSLQFMQMRLEGELARQLAAESGLSYPDYLVLVALTDRLEGRMRLFELAEILGWEKSRLSHHVARMTTRGLVKKERCDWDRSRRVRGRDRTGAHGDRRGGPWARHDGSACVCRSAHGGTARRHR